MEVPQVFAGSDSGTGTFKGFGGVGDSGGVQFFGLVFDAGGIVGVDLGQGAEEQAADVGKDGGATRRYAVLGGEPIEMAQRIVDALGSLEVLRIPKQDV